MHIASLIFIIKISLVDDQTYRNPICLCGGKKTVDEDGVGLRVANSDQQESLVKVGCYDVALFGKVGRFADDIVLAVVDLSDETVGHLHMVADGYRVCTPYASQTEVPLYFTIGRGAIVEKDGVPRTGILDD